MKVIYGIGKLKRKFKNTIVAIGVFDGVHRGHQKLIREIVIRAKKIHAMPIVVTFYPHPIKILKPKMYLPYIITLEHRLKIFEELGIKVTLVVNFTKRFSQVSPEYFIKKYLVDELAPKEVYVGVDFRFGSERSGGMDLFEKLGEKYGFLAHSVSHVKGENKKIGSTKIRRSIIDGNLRGAEKLLGRAVSIMGEVKRGDGRGAALGFPTINLDPREKVIPPRGVYASKVIIGAKKYNAMANIGVKPSFSNGKNYVNIEAHIFDFNNRLYGKKIVIEFLKKMRDERRFATKEDLISQLKKDQIEVKKYLKKSKN